MAETPDGRPAVRAQWLNQLISHVLLKILPCIMLQFCVTLQIFYPVTSGISSHIQNVNQIYYSGRLISTSLHST